MRWSGRLGARGRSAVDRATCGCCARTAGNLIALPHHPPTGDGRGKVRGGGVARGPTIPDPKAPPCEAKQGVLLALLGVFLKMDFAKTAHVLVHFFLLPILREFAPRELPV
jgi:hypothetical protein